MPTSALPRGPLTGQAIGHNRGQMRLDSNVVPFGAREVRPDVVPDRLTWFILHYLDESEDELRVELSVPVEFTLIRTRGGKERVLVTHFDPRLILPPIHLDDAIREDDEDEGDDQIDIQIPRR
jgi:hypothetical protein